MSIEEICLRKWETKIASRIITPRLSRHSFARGKVTNCSLKRADRCQNDSIVSRDNGVTHEGTPASGLNLKTLLLDGSINMSY